MKYPVEWPLFITQFSTFQKVVRTQRMNWSPKPKDWRLANINVCSTESNNFSKLAKNKIPLMLLSSRFTYYCHDQFFSGYAAIVTHFFYHFKMELWLIKLHSYIMINKAETLPLFRFPSVTTRPCYFSPHSPLSVVAKSIYSFAE